MLDKIVYAGVKNPSYVLGSEDLAKLAEVDVSPKQVERVTKRIGLERCTERDEAVSAYQVLPLVERKGVPQGVTPPELAVVGVDGGRLQILERAAGKPSPGHSVVTQTAVPAASTTAAEAASGGSNEEHGQHWREDKIGLLMTMSSAESAMDPCPEIPENFVDPGRIRKLVRELKKSTAAQEEAAKEAEDPSAAEQALTENDFEWQPPEVAEKRLVASRLSWEAFGPMVAAAAWTWGFFGATRKAFLGDGSENNWTLWRLFFSSFTPILDFIHVLSYVYAAATAGRDKVAGWKTYVLWINWVWQGQVQRVIDALAVRLAELGSPEENEAETSPRKIVDTTLGYLQKHKGRMRYDEYRRLGLPITSSYVESAVKQFNQRVKGTEKFWSEEGAETILQLRADVLSDHQPLEDFWERRQDQATGQSPYKMAA